MAAARTTAMATNGGGAGAPPPRPPPAAFGPPPAADEAGGGREAAGGGAARLSDLEQAPSRPRGEQHQHSSLETEVDYEVGGLQLREEGGDLHQQHAVRRLGRIGVAGGDHRDSHYYYEAVDGGNNNPATSSPSETDRRRGRLSGLRRGVAALYKRSLAAAPTTPLAAAVGVPLLALASHALFAHGQSADMWRLQASADVDAWYNATSFEARSVFRLAGIGDPYNLRVRVIEDSTVQTFTYGTAIQELWDAAGMNDVNLFLPRLASVLLVAFSGVWPHLKLLLLNLHWLLRPNSPRVFWWLSALGKWSLSDVLVVCLMLGILHVDWDVEPDVVLRGVIREAPTILKILPDLYTTSDVCTYLLARPCTERSDIMEDSLATTSAFASWGNETLLVLPGRELWLGWDLECSACLRFVESSLAHPQAFQSTVQGVADGIGTSGGGRVSLRVQGLAGIYSFCAAVVLSIALSCLVDVYAIRAASASRASSRSASSPPPRPPRGAAAAPSPQRTRVASCERPLLDAEAQDFAASAAAAAAATEEEEEGEDESRPPAEEAAREEPAPLLEPGSEDDAPPPAVADEGTDMARPAFDRTTSSLSSSSSSSSYSGRSASGDDAPPPSSCRSLWLWSTMMLSWVTAAIVWTTLRSPSLAREVTGVGPHWLGQVTGVRWDGAFSLVGLARSVGEAGGMDRLLQGTFAWFCVAGPAARAGLCALALLCPAKILRRPGQPPPPLLLAAIDFVGAFCAVEVLVVAAYLVHALIPSTTATIVDLPQCAQIAPANSTAACFQVLLEPQPSFQWLGIGTVLLLVVAQACQWLLAPKHEPRQRRR